MTEQASGSADRRYAGLTSDQRRAGRREALVKAGLHVFGTEGFAGTKITRLCEVAGVATRGFYQEYATRERLLLAVYQQLLDGAHAQVSAALERAGPDPVERMRAGLAAYVGYLTSDPRRARVAHREVRVAGVLEAERHAAVQAFATLIEGEAARVAANGGSPGGRRQALALAGAVNELLIDWVDTDPHPPTAPLVDELVDLFSAATGVGAAH
jgi:AcrR family transcriptional regulator